MRIQDIGMQKCPKYMQYRAYCRPSPQQGFGFIRFRFIRLGLTCMFP